MKASGKAHRSLWWVGALYLYSDQLLNIVSCLNPGWELGLPIIRGWLLSCLPINRTLLGTIPADFHRTSQSTVNMLSFFLLFLFFPQSNQPISSPQALNPYLRQQDWPIIYLHFPISRGSYLPLTSKTRMIYSSRDVMAHQDLTTSGSSLYLTQPCAILESRWKH